MDEPLDGVARFFRELKRRNVYRVAVTYAVVGFVLIEAADLIFPALNIPSWTYSLVVVLVLFGFPVALVVAWAYDLTPEGVRRTPAASEETEAGAASRTGESRSAMKALVGLGIVAAAVAGGWYLTGGGGETEPRAGDRSIAVLPFENMGGQESEQFTRGVHDDLLTRLAHVSGLKVLSRQAVEPYRDSDLTMGAIADSLGVRWVMEGAVQKMGDQIQVNAQLIDPRTETHAWADRYRRDLTAENLFDLQSEITKKIARSLEAELTPEETEQVERRPTGDLEAYKLYVQGRSRLDSRTEEGIRAAVEHFQRAIEQDSSYALAWSGLADAVGLHPSYGLDSVSASLPGQEEAARRARELDPELAEAHASTGLVHYRQRNAPAALRELERAVELRPSYAQAHHWLGLLLFDIGRLEAAREHVSLAVELNPRHAAARAVLVGVLLVRGEGEEARSQLRAFPEDYPPSPFFKAEVLYHIEQWDQLRELARDRLTQGEEVCTWCRFVLARVAALRGDTAAAREHLAELQGAEAYFQEGLVHAALGDEDRAFTAFRQVEDWGYGPGLSLRYLYPDILDPLRDDPRHDELIRRANRYWGLNPDGSLPDSVDAAFEARSDD